MLGRFGTKAHLAPREHLLFLFIVLADVHEQLALELVDANAAGAPELDIELVFVTYIGVILGYKPPSIRLPSLVI